MPLLCVCFHKSVSLSLPFYKRSSLNKILYSAILHNHSIFSALNLKATVRVLYWSTWKYCTMDYFTVWLGIKRLCWASAPINAHTQHLLYQMRNRIASRERGSPEKGQLRCDKRALYWYCTRIPLAIRVVSVHTYKANHIFQRKNFVVESYELRVPVATLVLLCVEIKSSSFQRQYESWALRRFFFLKRENKLSLSSAPPRV